MYTTNKIFTIPNLLTILRLLLLPLVLLLIIRDINHYRIHIFALLLLQGITDVLDGYIARKFHCISEFGKALDPIVDKLLIAGIMISLLRYGFSPYLFWLVIIRDILIVLVGYLFIMRRRHFIPVSNFTGKAATFFLVSYCLLFIAGFDWLWYYIVTVCVVSLSALSYTVFTIKLYLRGRK